MHCTFVLTPYLTSLTIIHLRSHSRHWRVHSLGAVGKKQIKFWEPSMYPRTLLNKSTCLWDLGLSLLCTQQPLLHTLKNSSKLVIKYPPSSQMSKEQNFCSKYEPLPRGGDCFAWAPSSWRLVVTISDCRPRARRPSQ